MAVSYVLVTLVIVLLLEGLIVTVIALIFTRSPFLGYLALTNADHAAEVYALQAALLADEEGLDADTTFEPGQASSLGAQEAEDHPQLSYFNLDIPYLGSNASAPQKPSFSLLVDAEGKVLASSYPGQYPARASIEQVLPQDLPLIQEALQGNSDGSLRETPQGRVASVARTIWSKERQPIGAIYIQTPAGELPDPNLIPEIGAVLIPSALVWLCLMLPIGIVFGFLTTRGLVLRIEHLAEATGKFTQGDFSVRVPVRKADEIGNLEQRFNGMAEQLVESFDQRQALAEQSARQEERARIEQEMASAQYVQKSLLPDQVPSIQGWHIEPYYCPAREVSGDLYDFLHLPDGRIGIIIGDVSGKGMSAALIMATTCAMMRAAARGSPSPGEVLSWVNNLLKTYVPPGMFVTCFYAILDPVSSRLCFANAGHNIPYLSRDGEIIELRAKGMPLGLMPDQSYVDHETILQGNDAILFYTDGLVEAHNPQQEMFSLPRLHSLLKDHDHRNGLLESLNAALKEFTGTNWEQEDDITLVTLRREG